MLDPSENQKRPANKAPVPGIVSPSSKGFLHTCRCQLIYLLVPLLECLIGEIAAVFNHFNPTGFPLCHIHAFCSQFWDYFCSAGSCKSALIPFCVLESPCTLVG
uniref:Uncharacterized protein n=1 Tax=Schistocephalus solidus TaxID=70667 RepID=A0A0X3Q0N9_SCHSO